MKWNGWKCQLSYEIEDIFHSKKIETPHSLSMVDRPQLYCCLFLFLLNCDIHFFLARKQNSTRRKKQLTHNFIHWIEWLPSYIVSQNYIFTASNSWCPEHIWKSIDLVSLTLWLYAYLFIWYIQMSVESKADVRITYASFTICRIGYNFPNNKNYDMFKSSLFEGEGGGWNVCKRISINSIRGPLKHCMSHTEENNLHSSPPKKTFSLNPNVFVWTEIEWKYLMHGLLSINLGRACARRIGGTSKWYQHTFTWTVDMLYLKTFYPSLLWLGCIDVECCDLLSEIDESLKKRDFIFTRFYILKVAWNARTVYNRSRTIWFVVRSSHLVGDPPLDWFSQHLCMRVCVRVCLYIL